MVSRALAVYAETASALADPRVVETIGATETTPAAVVSWRPERGWLCSATGHHVQPCSHTADLEPARSEDWNQ